MVDIARLKEVLPSHRSPSITAGRAGTKQLLIWHLPPLHFLSCCLIFSLFFIQVMLWILHVLTSSSPSFKVYEHTSSFHFFLQMVFQTSNYFSKHKLIVRLSKVWMQRVRDPWGHPATNLSTVYNIPAPCLTWKSFCWISERINQKWKHPLTSSMIDVH